MKKTENEKYLASRKLIEYVRKNEARAQKVPAFCRIISNLEAQTKLVSAAESQSTQDTTGATKEKNNFKEEVKNAVVRLGKIMVSYAIDKGDVVLENKFNALHTKLSKAREGEFVMKCKGVLEEAKNIIAALADHGFTQADLTALEIKVKDYDAKTPQTGNLKTDKKEGTTTKRMIFKKVSKISNKQIKNSAAAFMGVDDELYNGILDCLKMKKSPVPTPTQIKVVFIKVSEAQKGFSHKLARVAESNKKDKRGRVNDKNELIFKIAKNGIYALKIPLPSGEIKLVENIEVKRGQTTVVEVTI